MFENMLKLEKLANFAKRKIEIKRANLKSVASYKTEECTKGTFPVLDTMLETDADTMWTEGPHKNHSKQISIQMLAQHL